MPHTVASTKTPYSFFQLATTLPSRVLQRKAPYLKNYMVSMNHKISIHILKSVKYDYETTFKNNPDFKKLEFLKSLLKKFESLKQNDVFSLTVSPFIEDPPHVLEEIKELREDCLSFLDRMVNIGSATAENRTLSSTAQVLVGICYEHGILGLPLDYTKALNFYEAACRLKSGWASFRQAQCHEKGLGTSKSAKKAAAFYRLSAKLGYIESLYVYGAILLYGQLGLRQDIPNAIFFLSMAAKKSTPDYPYAFFDLGQFYEGKIHSEHEDKEYALELYTRGADKGCPNCLCRMGMIYEFGALDIKPKMSRAIAYYTKAAELGHRDALIAMSAFHATGIKYCIKKDLKISFQFALKAALRGSSNAAFIVAECIEKGIGTTACRINALWWYMISSSLGHHEATTRIDQIKSALAPAHSTTRRFKFF
ncbi:Chitin synthase regulatory factor 3 [Cucumispora dikerogammari]|nr:Chitin synthase regulatory factor 3 [Cucumispora dikerogammari]